MFRLHATAATTIVRRQMPQQARLGTDCTSGLWIIRHSRRHVTHLDVKAGLCCFISSGDSLHLLTSQL